MMGNATWKYIEQREWYRRAKQKLKQFVGKEPAFRNDVTVVTDIYSGWEVAKDFIRKDDILYSFGICKDIDFEIEAIQKNDVHIFAFDPTPCSVDWIGKQKLPVNFNFYPWASSGTDGTFMLYPRIKRNGKKSTTMYTFHKQEQHRKDGVQVDAFSLGSMAEKLGHKLINVLKMDIEGAEYEVLESMLRSNFRPRMLLIEFHHRFKGIGKLKTEKAVSALRHHGYLLTHISVNCREMCFVNQSAF